MSLARSRNRGVGSGHHPRLAGPFERLITSTIAWWLRGAPERDDDDQLLATGTGVSHTRLKEVISSAMRSGSKSGRSCDAPSCGQ